MILTIQDSACNKMFLSKKLKIILFGYQKKRNFSFFCFQKPKKSNLQNPNRTECQNQLKKKWKETPGIKSER